MHHPLDKITRITMPITRWSITCDADAGRAQINHYRESARGLWPTGDRPVLGTFFNDPLDVLAEVVDHVEG
jgi:hypothetical protein